MKVIFDFDDVIFDAKKFKEVIFSKIESRGIENVRGKYDTVRKMGTPFSLYSFIRDVTAETSVSNVDELYENILLEAPRLLNQKVVELMKKLGREQCIILTNGEQEFQEAKILRSGAGELTNQVIIVPGGKGETLRELCTRNQDEEFIFVDDKLEFINEAKGERLDNLRAVLFNESWAGKLIAEINESRRNEGLQEVFLSKEMSTSMPQENRNQFYPSKGLMH